MTRRRASRRPRRAAGFTLLELMVSLTIGGLAISAMYTIGAALVRQYHAQQQTANAMTSLRVALNQVKRDIARAGYLATPNLVPTGFPSLGCANNYAQHQPSPGSGALAAISLFTDNACNADASCVNVHAGINGNITNGFTADNLVLIGNYETSSEYPNVQLVTSTTVSVGRSAHSYQTDFTQWWSQGDTTLPDTDAFKRAFAPGRMIRIRTTSGLQHYARVINGGVADQTGTNDARVSFDTAIPPGCQAGTDGAWIAPISALRYYARNDPTPPNPNPRGPMAQLVREEVQANDKVTPLALTDPTNLAYTYTNTRVVLDYLVSFNLGFVVNTANPVDVYNAGNDTAAANTVNGTPERVRAVTIELSARSPDDDRALAPGGCANLRCFQVTAGRPAAARVRTLRAEVFVPNVAFESY
jgi:prepilin-type N-terminal cleavage/methylation domain-containing protein